MDDAAQRSVVQLLRAGEWFVHDTGSYADGDLLYSEVIAVFPIFPDGVDRVGDGRGGYRVRAHCSEDIEQGTPDGVDDHYTFGYVDGSCIRLTPRQVERARAAGWPSPRRFLSELQGSD